MRGKPTPSFFRQIPRLDWWLWALALLTVLLYLFARFLTIPFVIQGRSEYDEAERQRIELEIRQRQLEEELQEYRDEEEALVGFLAEYGSPLPREFVRSAIRVEEETGIENFAIFSLAVAGAESTFGKFYSRPFNVWGIGHCTGCLGSAFSSWYDGQRALAEFLQRYYGRESIEIHDLQTINARYAASRNWYRSVGYFFAQLQRRIG